MILLDTCTFLWLVMQPRHLSRKARQTLENSKQVVSLSSVSTYEIAIKYAKGKIELNLPLEEWIPRALYNHQIKTLDLDIPCTLRAANLPPLHNDPFDRLLIGTSQHHRMTLLTPDKKIHAYPDTTTVW